REFVNILKRRTGCKRKPERENLPDCLHIKLSIRIRVSEYGFQFRTKNEAVSSSGVKQRSHANAITGEEKLLVPRIPDREGPLPVHVLDAIRTIFQVEPQDDLSVRLGRKLVPLLDQIFAQLNKVEDFTIESDPEGSSIRLHWLVAAGNVNNAEPVMCQSNRAVCVRTSAVRPAIVQRANHSLQQNEIRGPTVEIKKSGYAAHIVSQDLTCTND